MVARRTVKTSFDMTQEAWRRPATRSPCRLRNKTSTRRTFHLAAIHLCNVWGDRCARIVKHCEAKRYFQITWLPAHNASHFCFTRHSGIAIIDCFKALQTRCRRLQSAARLRRGPKVPIVLRKSRLLWREPINQGGPPGLVSDQVCGWNLPKNYALSCKKWRALFRFCVESSTPR